MPIGRTKLYSGLLNSPFTQQFSQILTHRPTIMEEEKILIMITENDQIEQNNNKDLLDMLVDEPSNVKKYTEVYDYQPAPVPIPRQDIEDTENTELKVSNNSTSTNAELEISVRKCTCLKTRCLKNYCECFKLGLACTNECICVACCNRQRLFLNRMCPTVTKCQCQKCHCLKKYCQCHNSGKRCTAACKCIECENMEQLESMQNENDLLKVENEGSVEHDIFLDIQVIGLRSSNHI